MNLDLQSWFGNVPYELVEAVAGNALARTVIFLLVATRLTGFFLAWPLIERGLLPWPVKVGMVVLLTLIVAPGIELTPEVDQPIQAVSHQAQGEPSALIASSSTTGEVSSEDLIAGIICNAAVGIALALSMAVFLSGLKLAGEWIDRHSGLGMGQVLNPDYSSGDSGSAKLISLFCIGVILTALPMNGHLHLVRLILDTFRAIPVELTRLPDSLSSLLIAMMQQSFILGLRIAVPFVVAMSLVDLTLGWIRRSSRWELASIAFTIRVGTSLLVLAATLPGIHEAVVSSVQESFEIAANKIDSDTAPN